MSLKVSIEKIPGKMEPSNLEVLSEPISLRGSNLKKLAFVLMAFGFTIFIYLGWVYITSLKGVNETKEERIISSLSHSTSVATSFGDLVKNSFDSSASVGEKERQPNVSNSVLGEKTPDLQMPYARLPLSHFYVSIPVLQISQAKVTINVDGNSEEEYGEVLKNSLAHLKNSALPGERGTVFIFGHSTLPIFAKNNYESIFTNLPKLKPGDEIGVNYGDYYFRYIVYKTAVVDPDDLEALSNTFYPRLALMTCIPPGFGTRRFIAIAELE